MAFGQICRDATSVRGWIEGNTDSDNFYLCADDAHLLGNLETFLLFTRSQIRSKHLPAMRPVSPKRDASEP